MIVFGIRGHFAQGHFLTGNGIDLKLKKGRGFFDSSTLLTADLRLKFVTCTEFYWFDLDKFYPIAVEWCSHRFLKLVLRFDRNNSSNHQDIFLQLK